MHKPLSFFICTSSSSFPFTSLIAQQAVSFLDNLIQLLDTPFLSSSDNMHTTIPNTTIRPQHSSSINSSFNSIRLSFHLSFSLSYIAWLIVDVFSSFLSQNSISSLYTKCVMVADGKKKVIRLFNFLYRFNSSSSPPRCHRHQYQLN